MSDFLSEVFKDPIGRYFVLFGVLVAFVVFGGVFAWIVRNRLIDLAEKVGIVKDQVENDHGDLPNVKANLREDLDDKHSENTSKIDRLLTLSLANTTQLTGIHGRLDLLDQRLSTVEDTQTADAMKALKEKYHERSDTE